MQRDLAIADREGFQLVFQHIAKPGGLNGHVHSEAAGSVPALGFVQAQDQIAAAILGGLHGVDEHVGLIHAERAERRGAYSRAGRTQPSLRGN